MQKELGVYNPELDKMIREEILNINPAYDKALQEEFGLGKYYDLTKEFKELNEQLALKEAEIIKDLERTNPELFPHLERIDKDKELTSQDLGNLLYDLAHNPEKALEVDRHGQPERGADRESPDIARDPDLQLLYSLSQHESLDKEFDIDQLADRVYELHADNVRPDMEHEPSDKEAEITQETFPLYDLATIAHTDEPVVGTEKEFDAVNFLWESQHYEPDLGQDVNEFDPWQDESLYEDTTQGDTQEQETEQESEPDGYDVEDDIERDDDDW
jgi:hypothetical protein